jgi:hypothetical protein
LYVAGPGGRENNSTGFGKFRAFAMPATFDFGRTTSLHPLRHAAMLGRIEIKGAFCDRVASPRERRAIMPLRSLKLASSCSAITRKRCISRRYEMEDKRRHNACPYGNDCAYTPVRNNAKGEHHQADQQGSFDKGFHCQNMRSPQVVFQPFRLPQSNRPGAQAKRRIARLIRRRETK